MSYSIIVNKGTPLEHKIFFKDKKSRITHREDGPAIEWANGDKDWLINGLLHREDGPAIIRCNHCKIWYKHNELHREDGPAVQIDNGTDNDAGFYYLNNKEYVYEEFVEEIDKRKRFEGFI